MIQELISLWLVSKEEAELSENFCGTAHTVGLKTFLQVIQDWLDRSDIAVHRDVHIEAKKNSMFAKEFISSLYIIEVEIVQIELWRH